MDKLAEKFGLYDFWAIGFPGAIGIITLILNYSMVRTLTTNNSVLALINSFLPNSASQWIVFVLLCLLFGIILQEVGRWIRCCRKKTNAANGLLNAEMRIFTKKEIADLTVVLKMYGYSENKKTTDESRRLFHCLNIEAQDIGVASSFVKLSVLSKMALSLAVVMLINGICFLVETVYLCFANDWNAVIMTLLLFILSIALFFLLVIRSERFDRYWVRNTVYAMLLRASKENRVGKTVTYNEGKEKN